MRTLWVAFNGSNAYMTSVKAFELLYLLLPSQLYCAAFFVVASLVMLRTMDTCLHECIVYILAVLIREIHYTECERGIAV